MVAGEQSQDQSVRVRPFRIGSSQLRRHAIRHGGTQNRPVHRRQQVEVRASTGHAGESNFFKCTRGSDGQVTSIIR